MGVLFMVMGLACGRPLPHNGNDDDGYCDPWDDGSQDTDIVDTGDTDDSGLEVPEYVDLAASAELVGEVKTWSGMSVAPAGDVNGDGFGDVLVGAPGFDPESPLDVPLDVLAGRAYLVPGPLPPEGSELAAVSVARFVGEAAWDSAGMDVASGDLNGDGSPDMVIGAPDAQPVGITGGLVYAAYGPHSGEVSLAGAQHLIALGNGDRVGWRVAVGDINSDGFDDIAAGAPFAEPEYAGAALLWLGGAAGIAASPHVTLHTRDGEALGSSLALADTNGDGEGELITGAPHSDQHGVDAGTVYVVATNAPGIIAADLAPQAVVQGEAGDKLGRSLSAADVNGDGYDDLLIGAPGHGAKGGTYLLCGPLTANVLATDAVAVFAGEQEGDLAGESVDVVHDWNGDGASDFVVGAPGFDGEAMTNSGKAYLVFGPASGTMPLSEASGAFLGLASSDGLGKYVADVGDVNAGGLGDIMFSAPYANQAGARSGTVFVFTGE